jgi:hypothetical protein
MYLSPTQAFPRNVLLVSTNRVWVGVVQVDDGLQTRKQRNAGSIPDKGKDTVSLADMGPMRSPFQSVKTGWGGSFSGLSRAGC